MFIFLVLILFVPIFSSDAAFLFESFIKEFSKEYATSTEKAHRFTIFQQTLQMTAHMNADPEDGATYGVNEFADLTAEEFAKQRLMRPGYKPSAYDAFRAEKTAAVELKDLPDSWNWKDKGAVTRVKDQSYCGSCWAFSTIGNIEGQHFMDGNPLVEFSEEQIVECDNHDCACLGGLPVWAYQWYIDNRGGGVILEKDYPYCVPKYGNCYPCVWNTSFCGPLDYCNVTCRDKGMTPGAFIESFEVVDKDEAKIKQYLYDHGPLAVLLNASPLQHYHSGVLNPIYCPKDSLDHAVLLVGYGGDKGTLKTTDFWIVKNSWGSKWGESGYFRLKRGDDKCGIAEAVSNVILKK